MSCDGHGSTTDPSRASKFPMISVSEALEKVLTAANKLPPQQLDISEALGYVCAENIYALENFPAFPCSIMDGYAVQAPQKPGVYKVVSRVHAGDQTEEVTLSPDTVAYITTGSRLPPSANAVVKIEDTNSVHGGGTGQDEKKVEINVDTKEGTFVRQVGSDISEKELILPAGQVIRAAEIGLLATAGITKVLCHRKPIVGVISTGNELVDPWQKPVGSQIRDSNRASLMAAFKEDGFKVIDFGIIRDQKANLRHSMVSAAASCDVVVSSGGVSMGEADLVKPLLQELGEIHFGRLNMKPGKPTTFASLRSVDGIKNCLFFALPGNPVSCLVCKGLLVDPAMKRLSGLGINQCMPPQLQIKVSGEVSLKLDPERPEYHRSVITYGKEGLMAMSTGNQRSSRLMSMRSSNAVLCLPQQEGFVEPGTTVTALLTGPLPSPPKDISYHQVNVPSSSSYVSTSPIISSPSADTPSISKTKLSNPYFPKDSKNIGKKLPVRVGLLTVSDRASRGEYPDESGPEMARMLEVMADDSKLGTDQVPWPITPTIVATSIVPDDQKAIQDTLLKWIDSGSVDLVLTSGGTGFGVRDYTPEAIKPILHREAPGISQALLAEGLKFTPLALLSRPIAGTRGKTFICTLPGSVKAIRENIGSLKPLLPRIMELVTEKEK